MTDWNNKEEVLEAVMYDGWKLEQASVKLRADKKVVLAAVNNWKNNLEYRSNSHLEYASKKLKGDKEVVLAAVEEHYYALDFVSEDLLADKAFFITLLNIETYGEILQYASEKLRGDKVVVLKAINYDRHNLEFASEQLRNDPEFMKEVEQYL